MKEKKLKARLNSLYVKAKNKNRICCHNGCNKNAINSHILQKNGIMNGIATNGHIYVTKTDYFNDELFHFSRSGINTTFTFKGFCSEHDTSIFKPIEDYEIDYEDYKSQLLFAYRTILNEKRKKEVLIDYNNSQLHDDILSEGADKEFINELINQNRLAINDLEYYENKIVSNLESEEQDFIFHVRFIKEKEICLASHFTYETTRERQEYIDKTGKDFELLTDIYISLFPLDGENVLIIGYLQEQQDKCGEYVSHLFEMEESELLLILSNLMLRRCEEWACSEKFYNEHIKERESEIFEIIREAAESPDEDEIIDFNIFD